MEQPLVKKPVPSSCENVDFFLVLGFQAGDRFSCDSKYPKHPQLDLYIGYIHAYVWSSNEYLLIG